MAVYVVVSDELVLYAHDMPYYYNECILLQFVLVSSVVVAIETLPLIISYPRGIMISTEYDPPLNGNMTTGKARHTKRNPYITYKHGNCCVHEVIGKHTEVRL